MTIAQVASELKQLEPFFHTPATYPTPARVEELLDPDFCEVGGSGRKYCRAQVVQILAERTKAGIFELMNAEEFSCIGIADDSYLATYLLRQKDRLTHRSSIWRLVDGCWKILYHQGTVVQ